MVLAAAIIYPACSESPPPLTATPADVPGSQRRRRRRRSFRPPVPHTRRRTRACRTRRDGCGRRGRRPSEWSRSADSESETDDGEDRCQAHHLRWEDTKGSTQLASSPCRGLDVQSQSVLTGDAKALNDVDMASLCPTHRALYLTLRWNHKCPVADCCRAAATKVGRLRLCSLHADEERLGGRKDAMAPRSPSPRTAHDALDRLDLGGGGAAGLRKRRTSKSPVTALS